MDNMQTAEEIRAEIERLNAERTALVFRRAKPPEIMAINDKILRLRERLEAME